MTQLIFIHKDVNIRSSFYEIGKESGFTVTTANFYEEVLELLKKVRPEFIVVESGNAQLSPQLMISNISRIDPSIKIVFFPGNFSTPELMKQFMDCLKKRKKAQGYILIVDDDRLCADMEKSFLRTSGLTVESAYSGEEALSKLQLKKPDIILLDVCMPGMDGEVTLQKIREIDREIPVIMTTAVCEESTVKETIKLGVSGYLLKPFSLEKLHETILKYLYGS